jgi:hypothetical protein
VNRRYYRTVFLGVAALGTLVWAAIEQFDVPVEDMFQLFIGTLLSTLVVILFAALAVGIWMGVKKVLRRGERD